MAELVGNSPGEGISLIRLQVNGRWRQPVERWEYGSGRHDDGLARFDLSCVASLRSLGTIGNGNVAGDRKTVAKIARPGSVDSILHHGRPIRTGVGTIQLHRAGDSD